ITMWELSLTCSNGSIFSAMTAPQRSDPRAAGDPATGQHRRLHHQRRQVGEQDPQPEADRVGPEGRPGGEEHQPGAAEPQPDPPEVPGRSSFPGSAGFPICRAIRTSWVNAATNPRTVRPMVNPGKVLKTTRSRNSPRSVNETISDPTTIRPIVGRGPVGGRSAIARPRQPGIPADRAGFRPGRS